MLNTVSPDYKGQQISQTNRRVCSKTLTIVHYLQSCKHPAQREVETSSKRFEYSRNAESCICKTQHWTAANNANCRASIHSGIHYLHTVKTITELKKLIFIFLVIYLYNIAFLFFLRDTSATQEQKLQVILRISILCKWEITVIALLFLSCVVGLLM